MARAKHLDKLEEEIRRLARKHGFSHRAGIKHLEYSVPGGGIVIFHLHSVRDVMVTWVRDAGVSSYKPGCYGSAKRRAGLMFRKALDELGARTKP